MEGQGVPRPETVGDATDSSAEKGLEANRPPGTAQTGRPATDILGRCRRWRTRGRNTSGAPDPPQRALPTQASQGLDRQHSNALRASTRHAWPDPEPVRYGGPPGSESGRCIFSSPGSSGGSQHKPGVATEMWRPCGSSARPEQLHESGSLVADGVFAPRVPERQVRPAGTVDRPADRRLSDARERGMDGHSGEVSPPDQLGAAMRRIRAVHVATQRTPTTTGQPGGAGAPACRRLRGFGNEIRGGASTPHPNVRGPAGTARRAAKSNDREVARCARERHRPTRLAEEEGPRPSTRPTLRARAPERDTRIWRERQEGKGRGDTVRLQTRGVLRGVRNASRGTRSHGPSSKIRRIPSRETRRTSTGSRVQQTCTVRSEQTARVVRNHAGGTGPDAATSGRCPKADPQGKARGGSGRAHARRRGGGKQTNPTRGRGETPGSERELRRRIKLQEDCTVGHSRVRSPASEGRPRGSAR